jgi:hypothetical protein
VEVASGGQALLRRREDLTTPPSLRSTTLDESGARTAAGRLDTVTTGAAGEHHVIADTQANQHREHRPNTSLGVLASRHDRVSAHRLLA